MKPRLKISIAGASKTCSLDAKKLSRASVKRLWLQVRWRDLVKTKSKSGMRAPAIEKMT